MPTTLERIVEDISRLRVLSCPRKGRADGFTEREWNYILWLHYLDVRDHANCDC